VSSLLRFEIRFPDGRKEVAVVDGERALIGNGAHCDIRLPMDQSAYEHVGVDVVGGTVRVEAKAMQPPALVNGMPFTSIPLGPDTPLKIGSTNIFVSFAGDVEHGTAVVSKKSKDETSPLLKFAALIVFPLGAYLLLTDDAVESPPPPDQLPEIFAPAATACPQTSPDQALAFANDKFAIAEGKRERSPFVPRDGVQAVELYELSSVCYKKAGAQPQAGEADTAAKQLRAAITQDFRSRRIRLEHTMAVGDYALAKTDVRILRALTEGKPGSYATWLATVNQQIKQKAPNP
jgi:hypothetical protein